MKRAALIVVLLLALSARAADKKLDVSKIHARIQCVQVSRSLILCLVRYC